MFNTIQHYLPILSSKQKKLAYIQQIAKQNKLSNIANLVVLLKDTHADVRQASYQQIVVFLHRISSKNDYYAVLKNCYFTYQDFKVFKKQLTTEQFITVLCIASCNHSGYIRQQALTELTHHKEAFVIKFLLFRLSDWVAEIREQAYQMLQSYLKAEYVSYYIQYMDEVHALSLVNRVDLSAFQTQVVDLLSTHSEQWIDNFFDFKDKHRIQIARWIKKMPMSDLDKVGLYSQDKHFMIRNFALDYFDVFTDEQVSDYLADKSARVRLNTLYKLQDKYTQDNQGLPSFIDRLIPFSYDNSASIRHFTRFELRRVGIDVGEIYKHNLIQNKPTQDLIGSISGMAEINATQYTDLVEAFLTSTTIKVQKTAFVAISQLNHELAYDFALQHLTTEKVGLRKLIYRFLAKMALSYQAKHQVIDKITNSYHGASNEIKYSMLWLLSSIGGYDVVVSLLIACRDEDKQVREWALDFIQEWQSEISKKFVKIDKAVSQQANEAYQQTVHVLMNDYDYSYNPLESLPFYLK